MDAGRTATWIHLHEDDLAKLQAVSRHLPAELRSWYERHFLNDVETAFAGDSLAADSVVEAAHCWLREIPESIAARIWIDPEGSGQSGKAGCDFEVVALIHLCESELDAARRRLLAEPGSP